ncbi:hypothetical protein IPZ58_07825 [Streptomyces roseoverticillatus]|uniref:hypothetical protein n=1 Tax=Streptomyces roseoverticillatus TaxID=66429 RepID=UPI001F318F43|nr:hypothetical protein [Streptomyces roseoverticillatus]MCF3101487.1 hypothetical protein [Streptomyces roseoverticillatus]
MSEFVFCPRVSDLLASIRKQGGGWTTHRVLRTHKVNGHGAPKKATARRDLGLLVRAGHLVRRYETPDRIFFTLNEPKGGHS